MWLRNVFQKRRGENHLAAPLCFHFYTFFFHLGAKFYLFFQGTPAILSIPFLEQEKVISM